ncbi:NAD(P)-binding protein [Decorospora gaudefroyi]|uniref:NAD(P)-binding protein n=1 Tax=Decorospora gaudefroyi TaxID=184978 RepID=A0A6A5JYS1_9PLEO|nr:NAD(P)-binding protein [Decorospora gaudefroyi]
MSIQKVAIFGGSGNFGVPIVRALLDAGFAVTVITRHTSTATISSDVSVVRTDYSAGELVKALAGHDAAICAVGPGGMWLQSAMIDAAEAAKVKRFILGDFGWGKHVRSFPEFDEVHALRAAGWDHAAALAEANPAFTWTGITTGNPIDWALRKFPIMGFDIACQSAIIYDSGAEYFTGTTLEGIGQAVVGVLQNPDETRNRFVKVMSIKTCQSELLEAFESVTESKWDVRKSSTETLLDSGRAKHRAGTGGWILELVVTQLFQKGESRSQVAATREDTDSDLLGVKTESARDVVTRALEAYGLLQARS